MSNDTPSLGKEIHCLIDDKIVALSRHGSGRLATYHCRFIDVPVWHRLMMSATIIAVGTACAIIEQIRYTNGDSMVELVLRFR